MSEKIGFASIVGRNLCNPCVVRPHGRLNNSLLSNREGKVIIQQPHSILFYAESAKHEIHAPFGELSSLQMFQSQPSDKHDDDSPPLNKEDSCGAQKYLKGVSKIKSPSSGSIMQNCSTFGFDFDIEITAAAFQTIELTSTQKTDTLAVALQNDHIYVYINPKEKKIFSKVPTPFPVGDLSFGESSKSVFLAEANSFNFRVIEWVKEGFPITPPKVDFLMSSVFTVSCAFSPDSKYLACASMDSRLAIFDVQTEMKQIMYVFLPSLTRITSLRFSPDSDFLSVGSWFEGACLFKKNNSEPEKRISKNSPAPEPWQLVTFLGPKVKEAQELTPGTFVAWFQRKEDTNSQEKTFLVWNDKLQRVLVCEIRPDLPPEQLDLKWAFQAPCALKGLTVQNDYLLCVDCKGSFYYSPMSFLFSETKAVEERDGAKLEFAFNQQKNMVYQSNQNAGLIQMPVLPPEIVQNLFLKIKFPHLSPLSPCFLDIFFNKEICLLSNGKTLTVFDAMRNLWKLFYFPHSIIAVYSVPGSDCYFVVLQEGTFLARKLSSHKTIKMVTLFAENTKITSGKFFAKSDFSKKTPKSAKNTKFVLLYETQSVHHLHVIFFDWKNDELFFEPLQRTTLSLETNKNGK